MVAAVMPVFRRNPDWPEAIRAGIGALFNFLASRPALAQLIVVEIYAAGPEALQRRVEALKPLAALIEDAPEGSSAIPAIALEGIAGGIYTLAYKRIRESGPEGLPWLAPVCTYLALAPFVGPEMAATVANGDGRTRVSREREETIRAIAVRPLRQRALGVLGERPASLEEIAAELREPLEQVRQDVDALERAGLVESSEEKGPNGAPERIFRSHMGVIPDSRWARFSLEERHEISTQVTRLITGELELAVEAKTFDSRIDRHLLRIPLLLDEQGWGELAEIYTEAENAAFEVQARSAERMRQTKDQGIHARGILALFEMPPSDP
jgi:DNA-binding transcriptional ArsR family regulator